LVAPVSPADGDGTSLPRPCYDIRDRKKHYKPKKVEGFVRDHRTLVEKLQASRFYRQHNRRMAGKWIFVSRHRESLEKGERGGLLAGAEDDG